MEHYNKKTWKKKWKWNYARILKFYSGQRYGKQITILQNEFLMTTVQIIRKNNTFKVNRYKIDPKLNNYDYLKSDKTQ